MSNMIRRNALIQTVAEEYKKRIPLAFRESLSRKQLQNFSIEQVRKLKIKDLAKEARIPPALILALRRAKEQLRRETNKALMDSLTPTSREIYLSHTINEMSLEEALNRAKKQRKYETSKEGKKRAQK